MNTTIGVQHIVVTVTVQSLQCGRWGAWRPPPRGAPWKHASRQRCEAWL